MLEALGTKRLEWSWISTALLGEVAWLAIGQAGSFAGRLLGIRILTGFLKPAQYGEFALVLSGSALVSQGVFGGLGQSALRYYAAYRSDSALTEFGTSVLRLALYAVVISCGLVGIVLVPLGILGRYYAALLVVGSATIGVLRGINDLGASLANGARDRLAAALVVTLEAWSPILAVAATSVIGTPEVGMACLGYSAGLGVAVCGSGLVVWWRRIAPEGSFSLPHGMDKETRLVQKRLLRYAWPFTVWAVPGWAQLQGDRWIVATLLSTSALGRYYVVSQLALTPVVAMSGLLSRFVSPILYERVSAAEKGRQWSIAVQTVALDICLLAVLGTGLTVAFKIAGGALVRLVAGTRYAEYAWLLPWAVVGSVLAEIGRHLALVGFALERSRAYVAPKTFHVVVQLGLAFVLTPIFGVPGIIAALAMGGVFYILWNCGLALSWRTSALSSCHSS